MNVNSVFGLKEEMKHWLAPASDVLPEFLVGALSKGVQVQAMARAVNRMHTREPASMTVAMGVAAGKRASDYHLGVRIQIQGAKAGVLAEQIAQRARGEADIRIVPQVRARIGVTPGSLQRYHRPLQAGQSVGHFQISAGTLGTFVEDRDATYVLSNNHVLADVNVGQPGDPILQPGPADIAQKLKVNNRTMIGVLDRFVPISFRRANVVDCALAALIPGTNYYPGWNAAFGGRLKGARPVSYQDLGAAVSKVGRTTGVTRGRITQVNVDRLTVDMSDTTKPHVAIFSDQIEVEGDNDVSFSDGGDSGSVIVDSQGYARALLFSGGKDDAGRDLTFANVFETVLEKLGVTLIV